MIDNFLGIDTERGWCGGGGGGGGGGDTGHYGFCYIMGHSVLTLHFLKTQIRDTPHPLFKSTAPNMNIIKIVYPG